MKRRQVLYSAVAVALFTAGLNAPEANAVPARREAASRAYTFLFAAMDAYPTSDEFGLMQSYTDQAGLFSTAFIYDNALAIFAFLASGEPAAVQRAVLLGDSLRYAQEHDPQYDDGRLRQAYNTGPYKFYDGTTQPDGFVRPDGAANVATQFGFTGTAVGDMAWAGLAFAALAERTGAPRFLASAVRIGDWIERVASTKTVLGGYSFGVDADDASLPATSTEHNIDLVAFFGRLRQLTGDNRWAQRRERAQAFVVSMWEPRGGFFYTGTNDGVEINRSPVPADVQTWSALALCDGRYGQSVNWAAVTLGVVDGADATNSTVPTGQFYSGVTFSTAALTANEAIPIAPGQPKPDRRGVWFEGTAHLALALRNADRGAELLGSLFSSLERAQQQLGAGQTIGQKVLPAGAGIVAASSPIDTGFGYGYYPFRHVGATAWYLLAVAGHNPLG